ncbi:MAG TPA: iron-sulfur cluster assembly scaffold protein [Candidatus Omnitrophota bacterium]|nr:iron-sulfur cluster assembly scaffold protein [Candidatus Omnitrophota bacterium]
MADKLYRKQLLELYADKPNFGELKNKTHTIRHKNPVCNDEIVIELQIENNKIIDAKFHGVSCFVSTVSASALLEKIKGMDVDAVKKLSKDDLDKFLGIEVIPTRIGCELLPLEALKKLDANDKEKEDTLK